MDVSRDEPLMTAGLDLGDKYSYLCLIDQTSGEVLEEVRLRTTPKAFRGRFASQEQQLRIAFEAGTHSPWACQEDAEVFLITGRPPRLVEPLRATQDDANAAYSITFSLWISEETVVRAYRNLQSLHLRPPRDKTLRVLHFVSEQVDEGALPSWATLYDRWNAANPDDKFADRSALYKAYRRAVGALVLGVPHLRPTEVQQPCSNPG
jgi:hypothetical protein